MKLGDIKSASETPSSQDMVRSFLGKCKDLTDEAFVDEGSSLRPQRVDEIAGEHEHLGIK